jgi:RND family efflux transporter MFP subunit
MKNPALALVLTAYLAACSPSPEAVPAMDTRAITSLDLQAQVQAGTSQWDGVIEAVQQADLTAQTAGRVGAVLVDVNDAVQPNQLLLRLTGVEQQAGANAALAQVAAVKAQALEAESTYRRYAGLAAKQFVSKQQLDQALAARNAAQAQVLAAEAQAAQAMQQNDYTQVRAPFTGIVSERLVEPGESVTLGQPLLRVFNPAQLRIQVQVPQRVAEVLRRNPVAEIVLDDGMTLPAEQVVVYPSADAQAHSVTVRVLLPKTEKALKPGQIAKVVFAIAAGAEALWLPETAIWRRGELSGVYVVTDKTVLLRQLRLGETRAGRVEVLSGVSAGERIAADPAQAALALAAFKTKTER